MTKEDVDYKSFIAAINRSKTNSLGRMRPRPPTSTKTSPEIDRMNKALGVALEKHRCNPSKVNLLTTKNLEKKLRKAMDTFEINALLNLISRLESLYLVQRMKLFYKKVKERTDPASNPTFVIRNPDSLGNQDLYSTTKKQYLDFWTRYLEKTFARDYPKTPKHSGGLPHFLSQTQSNNYATQSHFDKPLTEIEVCLAIKTLKNLKAAGPDEVTNEDIKLIEELQPGLIHIVLQKILENERCPVEFRQSLFHLIPKSGKPGKPKDLRQQNNYRPIALLSTLRKLYEVIL